MTSALAAVGSHQSQPNARKRSIDKHWVQLARKYGVRLPQHSTGLNTGQMESWLRKLGVSRGQYLEWSGDRSLKVSVEHDPKGPLRAWVGILLEWLDELREAD